MSTKRAWNRVLLSLDSLHQHGLDHLIQAKDRIMNITRSMILHGHEHFDGCRRAGSEVYFVPLGAKGRDIGPCKGDCSR